VTLHFQFAAHAADRDRRKLIESLKTRGARQVRPLFPGDADPEFGAMQVVEAAPDAVDALLAYLGQHEDVLFAEPAARRKLG